MFGVAPAAGPSSSAMIRTGPDDIVETVRLEATSPAETVNAAIDFFPACRRLGDPTRRHRDRLVRPRGVAARPSAIRLDHDDTKGGLVGHAPGRAFHGRVRHPGRLRHGRQRCRARGRSVGGRARSAVVRLRDARNGDRRGSRHRRPGPPRARPLGDGPSRRPRHPGPRVRGCLLVPRGLPRGLRRPGGPARFGRRGEHLEGADRTAAAELVGFYLGAGIRSIIYALAPERIVIGGGTLGVAGCGGGRPNRAPSAARRLPGSARVRPPGLHLARPPRWPGGTGRDTRSSRSRQAQPWVGSRATRSPSRRLSTMSGCHWQVAFPPVANLLDRGDPGGSLSC